MALSSASESVLIEQNIPLVLYLVRRYVNRGVPREDLIQEALMGMVEAIRTYDSSKSMKLGSWIALHASHNMYDAVREERRKHSMLLLGNQTDLLADHADDQTVDRDFEDALLLVRQDLGYRQAPLFMAWLGVGKKRPVSLKLLCLRYHMGMPNVLQIIGRGIRSCNKRMGIDCRLDTVKIGKTRYDITRESTCLN